MGKREDYTTCMKPWMTGGGSDRKERFCIGAKVCSKGVDQAEATKLCAEAASNPKPPKAKRGRKVCTLRDLDAISICLTENIDLSNLTSENMSKVFGTALQKCARATSGRITSAKKTLEELDPQQIEALQTIALLSKQAEGRAW